MIVRLLTVDTGGAYALIEMHHPPQVGPALHFHPRGPETFIVLAGRYTFMRGGETIEAGAGEVVGIPTGMPHRYVVGSEGGRALVIVPPDLERYFWRVSALLETGAVPLDQEFTIAAEHGQEFQGRSGHWGGA